MKSYVVVLFCFLKKYFVSYMLMKKYFPNLTQNKTGVHFLFFLSRKSLSSRRMRVVPRWGKET